MSPRFAGIVRLYSPREVAEQQGTISGDYTVARRAAEEFYRRLRELFERGASRSRLSAPIPRARR